jgi:hypothetical protein
MVLTPEVEALVRPDEKVRHLALSEDEQCLAWVEGRGRVCIAQFSSNHVLELQSVVDHEHTVTALLFLGEHLVVGDDLEGMVALAVNGSPLASCQVDGGLARARGAAGAVVGLSGMGKLIQWVPGRPVQTLGSDLGLEEGLDVAVHGSRLYVAGQNGEVVAVENGQVTWRRPSRGVHGERITALGTTASGALFLTREGHALVAGDEEAIEFELWRNDALVHREDLRMRLLTSCPAPQGALLGFDNGRVALLHEDGRFEERMDTRHPVLNCVHHEAHCVVSSWFYVHGTGPDGEWVVEHQGMPHALVLRKKAGHVMFAGDDQNDYTAPEPIGSFWLDAPMNEADQAELGLWFEETSDAPSPTAEDLYGQPDDMLAHLTENERASFDLASPKAVGQHDVLLRAMGSPEEDEASSSEASSPSLDADALLEALQFEDDLLAHDSETLLSALNEGMVSIDRPEARAGEDQRLVAAADGSAIVTLDGRGTRDPHGLVVGWSWLNHRGVELATTSQLKLKLPVGRHVFELRVVDREGTWTADGVVVDVVASPTS